MYFKLAIKNVKKSFKDFLIYFLTLAFSVCLFYTFNSFQAQQAVLDMNATQLEIVNLLASLMTLLSVFVAIVLAFLILYANNFLIKRRKKELGLYTLLGMPKRKISRILVYETFIIGITSLVIGMITGILLSQVLTAVSAGLFEVPLDYHFVFSPLATLITVAAFGGIFFITMLFNTFVLNRYKLIDLLTADRKNDELKIKKVWVSVIIFMISILLLGGDYWYCIKQGAMAFTHILPICIIGIIGTFLFFLSLAGFLLTVIKSSKHIYFKNLNSFILRQINSNINSNFISMSIVCIMLLLSIGALSTGMSLNQTINATINNTTPYDYSYHAEYYSSFGRSEKNTHTPDNAEELLKNLPIDRSQIASDNFAKKYLADFSLGDMEFGNNLSSSNKELIDSNKDFLVIVTPLSTYNQERVVRGFDPISLNNKEAYLDSDMETLSTLLHTYLENKPSMTLYGNKFKVINDDYQGVSIGTTVAVGENAIMFVVNDSMIPKTTPLVSITWNVNLKEGASDETFSDMVDTKLSILNDSLPGEEFLQPTGASATKSEVYMNSKGLSVMFTYIGIYLGIVFLIASAVILALQQLSQASDNKKRYMILSKIGTEKRMMNRSILMQIAIYFILPLLLAIVHSFIGIKVVNELVIAFGKTDIMMSSLITAGIIICIYGSYFLVTYMGYKNIIKN